MDVLPHDVGRVIKSPHKGEFLRPLLDGNPILALDHSDFSALMANEKSFTQMRWKELSTKDVIGPVKAFHQVTGAGNMANAAQIPNCLTPEQTGDKRVDEDYLYVFGYPE